jgi:uncharacterized BrkB/YihY/UPF0761 family membrane protein
LDEKHLSNFIQRWEGVNELDNKGRSLMLFIIGVLLVIASIVLGLSTGNQTINQAKHFDLITAMTTYFWGIIIAAVLMAVGVVLAYLGAR